MFVTGAPLVLQVLFVVAFVVAVVAALVYLMTASGWRQLAQRHRGRAPAGAEWRGIPTGQMALVSVHHPDFNKARMRFVGGTLRVAITPQGLGLATPVSSLPGIQWAFPALFVPWADVTSAREFEAPGWVAPLSNPGALLQLSYDPNYTGPFVELEIGAPPVFVQLPKPLLDAAPLSLGPVASGTSAASAT